MVTSMEADPTHLGDRTLVLRSQRGDHGAFEELMRRHHTFVISVAFSVLRHHEEVEDVAQDAFIRAYEGVHRLRGEDHFGSWVARIARNAAISRNRQRARENIMDPHDDRDDRRDDTDTHGAWERRVDLSGIVEEIVGVLPDTLREPFVLRFMAGAKHREIAESLCLNENTVQKRIERALTMIRAYMQSVGKENEWQQVLRSNGLLIAAGAGFVARAMERVRDLPPPKAHQARVTPSEWVSCVAAAATTVGVLFSAFVGLRPAVAWGGDGVNHTPTIQVAQTVGAPRRQRTDVPTGPAMETRLDPAALATGWRAGITTYDDARPIVAHDNPSELRIANATGVDREMKPAYGKVILDFSAQPPYDLRAEAVIALDIDYGRTGSYMSTPEIVKTRDNWWACAEDDPAPYDAVRTDFRPLRRLVRYTGTKTRIRLVHRAEEGSYDIYIAGKLVADRVQRRWTTGLPVTGVHMRSGDEIWPGTGKLTRIWDMHVVADPAPQPEAEVEPTRYRGTISRRNTANIRDLTSALAWAVKLGNLAGIEAAHHDLALFHPDHPLTDDARGYMEAIVRPARARESVSDARLATLRELVKEMDAAPTALDADRAEQRFRLWAAEHAGVSEMWVEYEDERRKLEPNWSVRLLPEDYRGSGFLHQIAEALVAACQATSGAPGRVTVNVRPPTDLAGHAIVEAGSLP